MTISRFDPGFRAGMRGVASLAWIAVCGPLLAQTSGETVVAAEDAGPIDVPSGQPVTPIDVITDAAGPAGLTVRFRFLAPEIAPDASIGFDTATSDMAAICETYALPRLIDADPQPAQIIISMADRLVPFGQTDPDATQFFEAYRIEDGQCLWEMF